MARKYLIIVWAALALFPATWLRADDPVEAEIPPVPGDVADVPDVPDVQDAPALDEPVYDNSDSYDRYIDNPNLVFEDVPYAPQVAARFGWWATDLQGSPTKVGEWQGVDPSPFWDVDGLHSDGLRTFDFFATGTDNETSQMGVTFYGPYMKATFDFQRFIHRLDHDPMSNFNLDVPGFGDGRYEQRSRYAPPGIGYIPGDPQFQGIETAVGNDNRAFNSQDLNVGEDYAIRVQQLRAEVSGALTEHFNYRVKVWGQRKSGERQANSMAHCFNGGLAAPGVPADHPFVGVAGSGARSCHILTRRQDIDWLTEEITPSIEGKFGPVTVEYSHVVRGFSQNDQALSRYYTAGTSTSNEQRALGYNVSPPAVSTDGTPADYASVPENLTHMGQLRVGVQLTDTCDLYAIALAGNTHNKTRLTDRDFYGFDMRLTDTSLPGLTNVAYAEMYAEDYESPPFIRYDELGPPRTRVGFEMASPSQIVDPTSFQPPGNPFGVADPANPRIRWRGTGEHGFLHDPWEYTRTSAGLKSSWSPSAVSSLRLIGSYDYTNWDRRNASFEARVPDDPVFSDPDLFTHEDFVVGTTIYHTLKLRAQTRCWSQFDAFVEYTRRWIHEPMYAVHEPNGVTNSNLPTSEDLVRFGGTWFPSENLVATAWLGIENRSHSSAYSDFDEDDYPLVCTVMYAPTELSTVTLGYAYFSNWVQQDITLGDQIGGFRNSQNRIYLNPVTERFSYGGQASVISLDGTHTAAPGVHLTGGIEYTDSVNKFASPTTWPDLPTFSRVRTGTWRARAGVDYALTDCSSCYLRYNLFHYNDMASDFNDGTLHMVLAGVSGVY